MMANRQPEAPFLTIRRVLGLIGASVIATVAYGFVVGIQPLEAAVFFVVFVAVFTVLNYLVWKYD